MPPTPSNDLERAFEQVGQALRANREALNQADPYNANHGDHILAVFEAASQAARQAAQAARPPAGPDTTDLAEILDEAARRLEALPNNGTAQVYRRGLQELAGQFRRHGVSQADLLAYVRQALAEDGAPPAPKDGAASAETLKSLVNGLAAWMQSEAPGGGAEGGFKLNMGALFEFGMAYMQAKQRGGSRVDVLADTAASLSPLSHLPHRYESARIAIAALLRAIQNQ